MSMNPEPVTPEQPVPATAPTPGAAAYGTLPPLSPSDERTWAMLAHLSVLLNLVTGFLGVGAALLIYLLYKDRSRYVAFQALQAFFFQLIFWGGGGLLIGLMWAAVGILCAVLIGLILIPVAVFLTLVLALFPLFAVIYGVYGAIQAGQGADFRYWLIGDWMVNAAR